MSVFAGFACERPEQIAVTDGRTAVDWVGVEDVTNRAASALSSLDLGEHRRLAVFAFLVRAGSS